ncbi:transposase [Streptomyces melanogenes]|uniref:transposase n=1 Tax=Streptomyces melanogenes TaxID=67326 RepID=UPI00379CFFAA
MRVRAEQQTPEWKARYAVRSGVEGAVNEFTHGHEMRRCRYRGQPKAPLQHVLTALAVNIERLSSQPATEKSPTPRPPTADRLPDLPRTSTGSPARSPGEPSAPDLNHQGHRQVQAQAALAFIVLVIQFR